MSSTICKNCGISGPVQTSKCFPSEVGNDTRHEFLLPALLPVTCNLIAESFNGKTAGDAFLDNDWKCRTCKLTAGAHPLEKALPPNKKSRKVLMHERILLHQYDGDSSDLAKFITGPVPFKIVVTSEEFVDKFPDVFELGLPEYSHSVDVFMRHELVGDSEVTAVVQDSNWIFILERMLKSVNNGMVRVVLNKHDKSSTIRKRPDTVIMFRQAHILKNEATATVEKMIEADNNCNLSRNFAPMAYLTFPKNRSVIGILSCPQYIQLKEITYDHSSQEYKESPLASFALDTEDRLMCFIKAIFNVARYIISVTGPLSTFHLVPNMPMETDNGHRVVWEREGLRKTLNAPHRKEALLKYLYDSNLANVEWGVVEGPSKILITRIGHKLRTALLDGRITAEKAIADVTAGVRQMHDRRIAHTDLKVDNIFTDAGVAFIVDLEYITEIDTIMTKPYRVLSPEDQPDTMTAEELDLKQLEELVREIRSFQHPALRMLEEV